MSADKPLRILMYSSLFHPIVGGSERQAGLLASALVARGHEVEVVTQRVAGLPRHEALDGVRVRRELLAVGRGPVFAAGYMASSVASMLRRRRRAQLIHVHHIYMDALAAALLGPALGVPVIAKAACGGSVGDMARLARVPLSRAVLRLTRRIDRLVAISGQIADELLAHGYDARRIVRIPNAVDVGRFRPGGKRDAQRARLGLDGPTVIFVGRLDPQKGLTCLLEAWRQLLAKRADAILLILGTGHQEAALRAEADSLRLGSRVAFLGQQADVRPYLGAADALALPSIAEGMSNVLLEAMATALPCVATRVGGSVDVIAHGRNGLLVDPADPCQLAEALLYVLDDSGLAGRLGAAARATVEERYSLDRVADRYVALYRELVAAGRA